MEKDGRGRYRLVCSRGAWDEIRLETDDRIAIRLEAFRRLQVGYRCLEIDQETDETREITLALPRREDDQR